MVHTTNSSILEKKYDLEELRRLSKGDEQFFVDMINIFIRTTREGLQQMTEAVAKNDWGKIADKAHKILPPCRHLGANRLFDILKKIETDIRDHNKTDEIPALVLSGSKEAAEITRELESVLEKM